MLFENLGDLTFGTGQILYMPGSSISQLLLSDINVDGNNDVVMLNSNEIIWFASDGNGNFDGPFEILTNQFGLRDMDGTDINNDNVGDLVITTLDGISILINDGSGLFIDSISVIEFPSQIYGISVLLCADIDMDSDIDIVANLNSNDQFGYYENLGSNVFSNPVSIDSLDVTFYTIYKALAEDMDNDGDKDFVYTTGNSISASLNLGDGNYGTPIVLTNNGQTHGLSDLWLKDMDSDNDLDIVYSSSSYDVIAWIENINGTDFSTHHTISVNSENINSFLPIDLNADGYYEFFELLDQPEIILLKANDGQNNFTDEKLIFQSTPSRRATLGDLNGDGYPEVFYVNDSYPLDSDGYFENIDQGKFGKSTIINDWDVHDPSGIRVGDIDNDGDEDIMITRTGGSPDIYTHYIRNENISQDGVFDNSYDQLVVGGQWQFEMGDLDNDGDLDIASISVWDDSFNLHENTNPAYAFSGSFDVNNPTDIDLGDIDDDGDLDFIVAFDNSVRMYENLGEGTTTDQSYISIGPCNSGQVDLVDLNNDGHLDAILGCGSISYSLYNPTSGSFSSAVNLADQGTSTKDIESGDFDGDGDIDIVASSVSPSLLVYYENNGSNEFEAIEIEGDVAYSELDSKDINGDGVMDFFAHNGNGNSYMCWFENTSNKGCLDPAACNFDPDATVDGYCCYTMCGCMDELASNYNENATCENGSCVYEINVEVFYDLNDNGFYDNGEIPLPNQGISIVPDSIILFSDPNGKITFNSPNELKSLSVLNSPTFPEITTDSTLTFYPLDYAGESLKFGLSDDSVFIDIQPQIIFPNVLCNDTISQFYCIYNNSNVTLNGEIILKYDSLYGNHFPVDSIDIIVDNSFYYTIDSLQPSESICIQLDIETPSPEFIGEIINNCYFLEFEYDEQTIYSDSIIHDFELTCSYDPNDKLVFPVGYSNDHYIPKDEFINYQIRFQNTGNAPAANVKIIDTLDIGLNLNSFVLTHSSHNVNTHINSDSRVLNFEFDNIMLPDSASDESGSQGIVSFNIAPVDSVELLTEINNTAAIFFDNNPPIITNTTWSTIYDCSLFEVNFTDEGAILTATQGDNYQWFLNDEAIVNATDQEYTVTEIGNYSVQVDIDFPCSETSSSVFISVIGIDELKDNKIVLFPNPMTTSAFMELGGLEGVMKLEILDSTGRMVREGSQNISNSMLELKRGSLVSGLYVLRLYHDENSYELKFIVE